jgi:hypothetical protein
MFAPRPELRMAHKRPACDSIIDLLIGCPSQFRETWIKKLLEVLRVFWLYSYSLICLRDCKLTIIVLLRRDG